jgi:hypothetical protein
MAGISATTMAWGQSKHANVLFERGEKTLSLSIDNSPVMNEKLTRADIRLFVGSDDVTGTVFRVGEQSVVRGSIENMDVAMKWLQSTEWGMK